MVGTWEQGTVATRRYSNLPDKRCQDDFANFHVLVVALQNDRAWLSLIGVLRDGGKTVDMFVVDDLVVVQYHRDIASYQPDIVSLPFTRLLTGIHGGQNAAVKRAIS